MLELDQNQLDAVERLENGKILRADTGSGKTRTAIAYYYLKVCKGNIKINGKGSLEDMKTPRDLFVITTAKNRDDKSWIKELAEFRIYEDSEFNPSSINVTVDSWNNISKYKKVFGAFFIFDEQRLVGSGAWVRAFYNIARKNQWILLTATPGDNWKDYIPVFVANGFYRNKTDFNNHHAIMNPYIRGKVDDYIHTARLVRLREQLIVNMEDMRDAVEHHISIWCDYDRMTYRTIRVKRWDPYTDEPIASIATLCNLERMVSNKDPSRIVELTKLLEAHPTAIIFYNFDYELEIITDLLTKMQLPFTQWNGHKHEKILTGDNWFYVVQYQAACEAWNCITTNVIIFYSQNYSYRITKQSEGRINRKNTMFKDLYYYHLRSHSPIDMAIKRSLAEKKDFNEKTYAGKH